MALLSIFFIFCHDVVTQCDAFKTKTVAVTGNYRLNREEIWERAGILPGSNILAINSVAARKRLLAEPWYLPVADEVAVFLAAYQERLPVLLKGPTGCGKTRFVEHVTWHLYRGQEAAGIVSTDVDDLYLRKGSGLVADIFTRKRLGKLGGHAAIGHNRYSTAGGSAAGNAQPILIRQR